MTAGAGLNLRFKVKKTLQKTNEKWYIKQCEVISQNLWDILKNVEKVRHILYRGIGQDWNTCKKTVKAKGRQNGLGI